VILDFVAKIEDLSLDGNSPKKAFCLALGWLYTTDSWVYTAVNGLLRDDDPQIEMLAPYINAVMNMYKEMAGFEAYCYSGITYRRTKLMANHLEFYKPDVQFVWSTFISTTINFYPEATFGDVLFVISVSEKYKSYALSLGSISAFPSEGEVLLLPNIGFQVTCIEKGPTTAFPNTSAIIKIDVAYVCVI